jgi:hypothetical protein
MISDAIKTAFRKKVERGWDKWPHMFWAIDLHDVIIPGTYTKNNEGREFYPYAKEVLQWLNDREDMTLILYTSSHESSIADICEWLRPQGIEFDYINSNPECVGSELCSFKDKFYFDVMLEDKAGFVGESDWLKVKETLSWHGEWGLKTSHNETFSAVANRCLSCDSWNAETCACSYDECDECEYEFASCDGCCAGVECKYGQVDPMTWNTDYRWYRY